jgi:hypothetical protein
MMTSDVLGEDKSEQTIAEMRADGRLTDQDRLLIVSWRPPGEGNGYDPSSKVGR